MKRPLTLLLFNRNESILLLFEQNVLLILTPVPRLDQLLHALRPIPVPQLMRFLICVDPVKKGRVVLNVSRQAEATLALEIFQFFRFWVLDIEGQGRESWRGPFGGIWVGEVDLWRVKVLVYVVFNLSSD